jgi:Trp operon repressor
MEPDELRQMMGDEAYFAARKLEEQDKEADRQFEIFDQFYQIYGEQLEANKMAERWKRMIADQEFGVKERALIAKNAKLEQEKKEEQEKAKILLKAEQEKAKKEQILLLKAEQEKAKKEQILLLKAEKAKAKKEQEKAKKEQALLLKAEQEKAKKEQIALLKAKEAEAQIARLKIVQKMLDKGNSVEIIADLLDVSVQQAQEWIKLL